MHHTYKSPYSSQQCALCSGIHVPGDTYTVPKSHSRNMCMGDHDINPNCNIDSTYSQNMRYLLDQTFSTYSGTDGIECAVCTICRNNRIREKMPSNGENHLTRELPNEEKKSCFHSTSHFSNLLQQFNRLAVKKDNFMWTPPHHSQFRHGEELDVPSFSNKPNLGVRNVCRRGALDQLSSEYNWPGFNGDNHKGMVTPADSRLLEESKRHIFCLKDDTFFQNEVKTCINLNQNDDDDDDDDMSFPKDYDRFKNICFNDIQDMSIISRNLKETDLDLNEKGEPHGKNSRLSLNAQNPSDMPNLPIVDHVSCFESLKRSSSVPCISALGTKNDVTKKEMRKTVYENFKENDVSVSVSSIAGKIVSLNVSVNNFAENLIRNKQRDDYNSNSTTAANNKIDAKKLSFDQFKHFHESLPANEADQNNSIDSETYNKLSDSFLDNDAELSENSNNTNVSLKGDCTVIESHSSQSKQENLLEKYFQCRDLKTVGINTTGTQDVKTVGTNTSDVQDPETDAINTLDVQKSISKDGKEILKQKFNNEDFIYSGHFLFPSSNQLCNLSVRNMGGGYLIVSDVDKFVARVEINRSIVSGNGKWMFSESFEKNKETFFKNVTITEILEDGLITEKNEAYEIFQITLNRRIQDVSDNIEFSEDIFQLSVVTSTNNMNLRKPLKLLGQILQNPYISDELRIAAQQFWQAELKLYDRNKYLPKFNSDSNPYTKNLFGIVKSACKEGITTHHQNLIKSCPSRNSYLLCNIFSLKDLSKNQILFLNHKDIELFSDVTSVSQEESGIASSIIPLDFCKDLWDRFYSKVELLDHVSIKDAGPLTNSIYPFLLKSFRDVVAQISAIANLEPWKLIVQENGEFNVTNNIPWPTKSAVSYSLQKQYYLHFHLLKHFEPGLYSKEKRFNYTLKLLKGNVNFIKSIKKFIFGDTPNYHNMPDDRLAWLYIVDCGIAPILQNQSNKVLNEFSLFVFKSFVKIIEEATLDRYESFRIAARDIIKFVSQVFPLFSAIDSILTDIDRNILGKQMNLISSIFNYDETKAVCDYFLSLLEVYNEYWELRDTTLRNLPIPFSIFKQDMEGILRKLLTLIDKALSKTTEAILIIRFLRFYNEFLKHIESIDFSWLISKNHYSEELELVVETITKNEITSYLVKEPEDFVRILNEMQAEIPQHFLIQTVDRLLDITNLVFDKLNWSDEDCLNAVADLFLAFGHSFTHFEDQTDYTDLEHFLRDCTTPFFSVITNSDTYEEFKTRLDNVENFFLYTRKQNQIGIQRALDLCELEVKEAEESGFNTCIDRSVLETCYNRYSEKLRSIEHLEIPGILDEIANDLAKVETSVLEQWTPQFKQSVLPDLLAEISAVWSIQESKDIALLKRRIEPHCIQILCILRLLGVDHLENGVPKHFAQVLTGQGKSVILGFTSTIIALTGNNASVVCYSRYLAKRDKLAFNLFFDTLFKFNIKEKINYNTFSDLTYDVFTFKVDKIEKSLGSIIKSLLFNKLKSQSVEFLEKESSTVLLIDEADVFFSDDFYGCCRRTASILKMPALLEIQPKLWEIVESGFHDERIVLEKIKDFIAALLEEEMHEEFKSFVWNCNALFEMHLKDMVTAAINVSRFKTDNDIWFIKDYKIDSDGIITVKNKFGLYQSNSFHGYKNVFNYFRLKKQEFEHKCYQNYGYLQIFCGSSSYSKLPLRYKNILGVSGTLMSLDESEQNAMKSYEIKTMSAMPSFFGERKLAFNPIENFVIQDSESSWLSKIFDRISDNIKLNRAVLVFFDTDSEIKAFEEKYRSNINRLYILTGNEEPFTMEWCINEAGVAQTVTLATRAMGRGIDYKSNDRSVEENGGVHVIQTFFSLDEKEETQIKGRTARKDNKGSYELVLCKEHLKKLKCSINVAGSPISTYEELCGARKRKAKERGVSVEKNLKKSDKEHNLTCQFYESLVHYTPEKRLEYLSRYPFIND